MERLNGVNIAECIHPAGEGEGNGFLDYLQQLGFYQFINSSDLHNNFVEVWTSMSILPVKKLVLRAARCLF